ncbi:hypothetical protein CEUSTIGMA_g11084.t1 [Chlamydomonas eustigma]|uniref:RZ-type domain-containing protein n=1 Tax=Chlamydomonas eustigma TaxID=1157962 RepID=A0A250XL57_9CHLO|nr:hypothetical protein CEUSTIGMA_g11084.t1 [Chlamydomonas eustigma]|eukprot:GAX83659.1 hypothetical protein CEUSTIGMA_g11084.t1 [Chlamydomonas eustigma]
MSGLQLSMLQGRHTLKQSYLPEHLKVICRSFSKSVVAARQLYDTTNLKDKAGHTSKPWADIIEPCAVLLNELLSRFQSEEQHRRASEGCEMLLPTLHALAEQHLRGEEAVEAGYSRARWRRLQDTLSASQSQLGFGFERSSEILSLEEASKRRAEFKKKVDQQVALLLAERRCIDPHNLPGELRPGGPRHDNDLVDFRQIKVVPTADELMSSKVPYLPSNCSFRGAATQALLGLSSMHGFVSCAQQAHLETHFRLLRHDMVQPLAQSIKILLENGGLRAVHQQLGVLGGTSSRAGNLLKFGNMQVFAYRHCMMETVQLSKQRGLQVQISFELPPDLEPLKGRAEMKQWWEEKNSRLSVGSLAVMLLCDSNGQQHVIVGVITERDAQKLCPTPYNSDYTATGEQRSKRPSIGMQFFETKAYEALLTASWSSSLSTTATTAAGIAGGHASRSKAASTSGNISLDQQEVVLVQDNNSFFAYEHILKAIQAMRTLPLARHLLPQHLPEVGDSNSKVSVASTKILHDALSQQPQNKPAVMDLPVYLEEQLGSKLDMSCLIDENKISKLPDSDQRRLKAAMSRVSVESLSESRQATILEDILAVSTLDRSQAMSLIGMLTQEVAVVQGPPGTGKTYLGVQFVKVLLANCSSTNTLNTLHPPLYNPRIGGYERYNNNRGHECSGPLLVVCLTNHALDSFLESLLDEKIDSIVRVGGRSKSLRLSSINLRNISEKAGGSEVYNLNVQINELSSEIQYIDSCIQNLLGRVPTWETLKGILENLSLKIDRGCNSSDEDVSCNHSDYSDDNDFSPAASTASLEDNDRYTSTMDELDDEQDWTSAGYIQCWLTSLRKGLKSWNWNTQHDTDEDDYELDEDGFKTVRHGKKKDLVQEWLAGNLAQEKKESGRLAGYSQVFIGPLNTCNRPLEELIKVPNVWFMSKFERQRVLQHILQLRFAGLSKKLRILQRKASASIGRLQDVYDRAALRTLSGAQVVGMTTSGVAKHQKLVSALKSRVVLVEEAAEVFEAHVLACLSRHVEHLVLVGDHEQLRPKASVYELQAVSKKGLDLDVSMLERLATSGFFPVLSLSEQRRMRPEISNLIRDTIYPELQDHPRTLCYRNVKGMVQNLFFWTDGFPEVGAKEGKSKSNPQQAERAVALMKYIILQGYNPADVVLLVPYVGQLMAVRNKLKRCNMRVLLSDKDEAELERAGLTASDDQDGEEANKQADQAGLFAGNVKASSSSSDVVDVGQTVRVATVDNFQGEEAKIILISLTRNNSSGDIGFLKMKNRINVLLSRAQHGMYILGNVETLEANTDRAPMWPQVLQQLRENDRLGNILQVKCENHGHVTDISRTSDFDILVGDGGCMRPCSEMLPGCGHVCPRRCHVDDMGHKLVKCNKPCDRLLKPCNHPCMKLCHQACGACPVLLEVAGPLPCGHMVQNVPCWKLHTEGAIKCGVMVEVSVPGCGHIIKVPCHSQEDYRPGGSGSCTHVVTIDMLLCGHQIQGPCGKRSLLASDPSACKAPCTRPPAAPCGHPCMKDCGSCMKGVLKKNSGVLVDGYLASHAPMLKDSWIKMKGAAKHFSSIELRLWVSFLWSDQSRVHPWLAFFKEWLEGPISSHTESGASNLLNLHAPCEQLCGRMLACKHECVSPCHSSSVATAATSSSCPPCMKPCNVACDHHKCKLKCKDICTPCASSCAWRPCAHIPMACTAPCGAPCDRPPCNKRCQLLLPCGHRCPGLCGEICADLSRFCIDPACMSKAHESIRNQCVDMIMMTQFHELSEEEVDADPLVVLHCGHAFKATTLDGHLGMAKYYVSGPPEPLSDVATWTQPMALPPELEGSLSCPSCRAPIGARDVRRYGRVVKKLQLDLLDRKYMEDMRMQFRVLALKVQDFHQELSTSSGVEGGIPGKQYSSVAARSSRSDDIATCLQALDALAKTESPKQRCYEAMLSRCKKYGFDDRCEGSSQAEHSAIVIGAAESSLLQCLKPDVRFLGDVRKAMLTVARAQLTQGSQDLKARQGSMVLTWKSLRAKALRLADQEGHKWVKDAAAAQAYTTSFSLARHQVDLMLHLVNVQCELRGMIPEDMDDGDTLSGTLMTDDTDSLDAVTTGKSAYERQQLEVIQKVGRVCENMVMQYKNWKRTLSHDPGENVDITHLQQVASSLPDLEKKVKGSHLREIMQVLAAASKMEISEVASYMQSHLYRCPNGHLYVIGDCGMAMETGRCPECGESVGGGSHTLHSTNSAATDVVAEMRRLGHR